MSEQYKNNEFGKGRRRMFGRWLLRMGGSDNRYLSKMPLPHREAKV
jgi:hypothetical protein